jgi:hypothetical protein
MNDLTISDRDEGKLWQYLEAASFIAAGTAIAIVVRVRTIEGLAFSTIGFLTGKAAYAGTKLAMNFVSPLTSKNVQRIVAWTVGIAAGAAAGYQIMPSGRKPHKTAAFVITAVGGVLGAVIRHLLFKGILKTLKH